MLQWLTALLLLAVVLPASSAGPLLKPGALPAACANPVPSPLPPARGTTWDQLVDGTLDPFGPVTFPSFGPPSAAPTPDSGSPPDDRESLLVEESFRPSAPGA